MTRLGITLDELPDLLDALDNYPAATRLDDPFRKCRSRDRQKNQEQLGSTAMLAAWSFNVDTHHAIHAANGAATLETNDGEFNLLTGSTTLRHFPFSSGTKKNSPGYVAQDTATQIKNIKDTAVLWRSLQHRRISALPYCRLAMLTATKTTLSRLCPCTW